MVSGIGFREEDDEGDWMVEEDEGDSLGCESGGGVTAEKERVCR